MLRVCENVLSHWNKLSSNSHHILYNNVLKLRLRYNQRRVLTTWKTRLSLRRVQSIQMERIAVKLSRRTQLSWIMRKFKHGVIESQRESKEEEMVAMKWEQVRGWLQD